MSKEATGGLYQEITGNKIYQQHDAAFKNVSAWVITDKNGGRFATVSIKFPKDGAGRLYAYVHVFCVPMVLGHANGYGYDKRSAAVSHASEKIDVKEGEPWFGGTIAFKQALHNIGGKNWDDALRDAGFNVFKAV